MMDGRRLSTQQSPNIVAGPTCPCLLLRRLTPLSKMPLITRQCNPPMLARYWRLNPTMNLIKEKPPLPLPHPPMTLTNPCLLGCIWGMIVPTWSVRLGLKDLQSQRKIQESQEVTTTIKEGLHDRLRNMVFEFLLYLLFYDSWLEGSLDNMFILDIWVLFLK